MASIVTENENLPIGEFTPFNDSSDGRLQEAVSVLVNTEQGYDTTAIDRFRQGVSIRQHKHVYGSSQPKIWSGNIKHKTTVRTLGQARSFVEYDNSTAFVEKPEFDPVWYIDDDDYSYPFPIIFNNGPQQEEEAIIEPFSIPMRKSENSGPYYPRSVKGTLEDGNSFDNLDGSTSRVEQFQEYNTPDEPRFFLDEGQQYFGAGLFGQLLDETYDPYMLFVLNGPGPYTDSVNEDDDAMTVVGGVTVAQGPFPGTVNNPTVLEFDGSNDYLTRTDSVNEGLLPGTGTHTFTAEAFIYPTSGVTGIKEVFSYGTNHGMSFNFNVSPARMIYFHSGDNAQFILTASQVQEGAWNHAAFIREVDAQTSTVTVHGYINGVYVGSDSSLTLPPSGSSFYSFRISDSSFSAWDGRLSSIKFVRRALTATEIFDEYNRLNNTIFKTDGAIRIEGYTPVIIRNIDPFDDTRDEKIVERLQTTDSEFISAVKALDFDLSEDIRGSFSKKSNAAGSTVYGPSAAIYGTDSIAFGGNIRGA